MQDKRSNFYNYLKQQKLITNISQDDFYNLLDSSKTKRENLYNFLSSQNKLAGSQDDFNTLFIEPTKENKLTNEHIDKYMPPDKAYAVGVNLPIVGEMPLQPIIAGIKQLGGLFAKIPSGLEILAGAAGQAEMQKIANTSIALNEKEREKVAKAGREGLNKSVVSAAKESIAIDKWIDKNIPDDPIARDNFWLNDVPGATAQMLGIAGLTLATGSGFTTVAMAGAQASSMAGEAYDKTKDLEKTKLAAGAGVLLGMTEVLPVEAGFNVAGKLGKKILERTTKKTAVDKVKGSLAKEILSSGFELIKSGTAEGLQEFGQTLGENYTAQRLYDATREVVSEEAWRAGASAFIAGMIMPGLAIGLEKKKQTATPEERKILVAAEKELSKKINEIKKENTPKPEAAKANLIKPLVLFGSTPLNAKVVRDETEVATTLKDIPNPTNLDVVLANGIADIKTIENQENGTFSQLEDVIRLLNPNNPSYEEVKGAFLSSLAQNNGELYDYFNQSYNSITDEELTKSKEQFNKINDLLKVDTNQNAINQALLDAGKVLVEYDKQKQINTELVETDLSPQSIEDILSKSQESPKAKEIKKKINDTSTVKEKRLEKLKEVAIPKVTYEDLVKNVNKIIDGRLPYNTIIADGKVYNYDRELKKFLPVRTANMSNTNLSSINEHETKAKDLSYFKDKELRIDKYQFYYASTLGAENPEEYLINFKKRKNDGQTAPIYQALIDINAKYDLLENNNSKENTIAEDILSMDDDLGVPAYHGSPYQISKFSKEKIGTEEGGKNNGVDNYVAFDDNTIEIIDHEMYAPNLAGEANPQLSKVEFNRDYTPKEVLELIPEENTAPSQLLTAVLTKAEEAGVKIQFVDEVLTNQKGERISATYNKAGNLIRVSKYASNVVPIQQMILHEGIHSITSMFLNPNSELYDKEFVSKLDTIREEAKKNIDRSKFTPDELYLIDYALQNNDELLAGVFSGTSHPLVYALNSIQSKTVNAKNKSLWNRIVELILDAYGKVFNDSSLLAELQTTLDMKLRSSEMQSQVVDNKVQFEYELAMPSDTPQYIPPIQETKQQVQEEAKEKQTETPEQEEYEAVESDNDTGIEDEDALIENQYDANNSRYISEALTAFLNVTGNSSLEKIQKFTTFEVFSKLKTKLLENKPLNDRQAYLLDIFNASYLSNGKPKGWTKEKYADRILKRIYQNNAYQKPQTVFNIVWNNGYPTFQQLNGKYVDPSGKKMDTTRNATIIHDYLDDLKQLFGYEFEVHYINGIQEGKRVKDIRNSKVGGFNFDVLAKELYKEGYIFLNVFGDKNIIPILKFRGSLQQNVGSTGLANITNLAPNQIVPTCRFFRFILEELRNGNTVENIKNKQFIFNKDTNFASLMKRATMAFIKTYKDNKSIIDKFKLSDKPTRQSQDANGNPIIVNNAIYQQNGKVVINHAFIDTKNINGELQVGDRTIPLADILFSKLGKVIPDGLTIVLPEFAELYYEATGSMKEGIIKSATVTRSGIYIKDSAQAWSNSDPIIKMMRANGIARLVFDTAEKNGNPNAYQKVPLNAIQGQQIPLTPIALDDIHPIKDTGEVKEETRGLGQGINGSGLSESNSAIKRADKEGKLLPILRTFASNIAKQTNKQIAKMATNESKLDYLKRIKYKSYSAIQQQAVKFLNEVKDEDVLKVLNHPYLKALWDQQINSAIRDMLGFKVAGSRPVFVPNLGYASHQPAAVRNNAMWDIFDSEFDGTEERKAIVPEGYYKKIKRLRALRRDYQKFEIDLKYKEDLLPEERARVEEEYNKALKMFESEFEITRMQFNNSYPELAVKGGLFKESDFLIKGKALEEFKDKQFAKKCDERGMLREGYIILDRATARQNGLNVGDKVITSITPTSDALGMNSFTIAAITPDLPYNSIVLPTEYLQTVGKDFDIDDGALVGYDKNLWTKEDWNYFTDTLPKVYKETLRQFKNEFTSAGVDNVPDEIERALSGENHRLQYMQKKYGAAESNGSWSMMDDSAFRLGEQFTKEVAEPVNMRLLHTLLNNIGLKSKILGTPINPAANFDEVYVSLANMTQDKVDFPKTTNWLQYGKKEGVDTSVTQIKSNLYGTNLPPAYIDAIELVNYKLFQQLFMLPRGKTLAYEGRTLQETLNYINFTKSVFKGIDKEGLKTAIKAEYKKLDPALQDYIDDYIDNLEISTPNNAPMVNLLDNFDLEAPSKMQEGIDYNHYRNTEYRAMRDVLPGQLDKLADKVIDYPNDYADATGAEKHLYRIQKAIDNITKIFIARTKLIQLMNPSVDMLDASGRLISSAYAKIRGEVFPTIMRLLFNETALTFTGKKPVQIGEFTFSQKQNTLMINNKPSNKLDEATLAKLDTLFKDGTNRAKFMQFVPITGANIPLTKRFEAAVAFLNSSKLNDIELEYIFSSLLTPYRVVNGEPIVKLGLKNLMRPHASIKGSATGYQINNFVYELAAIFHPSWLKDYVSAYATHNQLDSKNKEQQTKTALATKPADNSELGMPAEKYTRKEYAEALLNKQINREHQLAEVEPATNKLEVWKQLKDFRSLLKSNPKEAFAKLRSKLLADSIVRSFVIDNYQDYRTLLDDIRNMSSEQFQYKYGVDYVESISKQVSKHFQEDINLEKDTRANKILTLFYWDLLNRERRFSQSKWQNIPNAFSIPNLFVQMYGKGLFYAKDIVKGLRRVNLLNATSALENEDLKITANNQVIFGKGRGLLSLPQIFEKRKHSFVSGQLREIEVTMNTALNNMKTILGFDKTDIFSDFAGKEADTLREVSELTEFNWKKLGVSFNDTGYHIEVLYKGNKYITERELQQLATQVARDERSQKVFLAALELRKMYDVTVPKIYKNIIQYLDQQYIYYTGEKDAISKQNAKYIMAIRNRYAKISNAIEEYKEKMYSYFPRQYPNDVLETQFKISWFDQVVDGLKKQYPNWTSEQVEKEADRLLTKKFKAMTKDSAFSSFNPNFMKRELSVNNEYIRHSFMPHFNYKANLLDTVRQDLFFTEAILFKQMAAKYGEQTWITEHMLENYSLTATNPLLHTADIDKDKVRKGMQVEFIDKEGTSIAGEVARTSKDTIVLKRRFKQVDITDKGEQTRWIEREVEYKKSEIGTTDITGAEVRGKIKKFKNKPMYLLNAIQEQFGDEDSSMLKKIFNAQLAQGIGNSSIKAIQNLMSITTFGFIKAPSFAIRNSIGILQSVLAYRPFHYFTNTPSEYQRAKGLYAFEAMSDDDKRAYNLKRALMQEGLSSAKTFDTYLSNVLMMTDNEMEASLTGIYGDTIKDKVKEIITMARMARDKAGYGEYDKKRKELVALRMTSDTRKQLAIDAELQKLDNDWYTKMALLDNSELKGDALTKHMAELKKNPKYLNEMFDVTRGEALWQIIKTAIKGILIDEATKLGQLPERAGRTKSFINGYQDALEAGLSYREAVEKGKDRVESDHAKYEGMDRSNLTSSRLGKLIEAFSQYTKNRFTTSYKLIREVKQQAFTGRKKGAPSAALALTNETITNAIMMYGLAQVLKGGANLVNPVFQFVWSTIKALFGWWDDEDDKGKKSLWTKNNDKRMTFYQLYPYWGYGGGMLMNFLADQLEILPKSKANFLDYNKTYRTIKNVNKGKSLVKEMLDIK